MCLDRMSVHRPLAFEVDAVNMIVLDYMTIAMWNRLRGKKSQASAQPGPIEVTEGNLLKQDTINIITVCRPLKESGAVSGATSFKPYDISKVYGQ